MCKDNEFSELTAFTDYFADTDRKFYEMDTPPTENGGNTVCFSYPIYSDECKSFIDAVSEHAKNLEYIKIVKERGLTLTQSTDFSELGKDEMTALFTKMIRAMRFGNETIVGELAKKGVIYKMLLRLGELDRAE